jgi:hypothetical protein
VIKQTTHQPGGIDAHHPSDAIKGITRHPPGRIEARQSPSGIKQITCPAAASTLITRRARSRASP